MYYYVDKENILCVITSHFKFVDSESAPFLELLNYSVGIFAGIGLLKSLFQ